jgi:hypothetical protein
MPSRRALKLGSHSPKASSVQKAASRRLGGIADVFCEAFQGLLDCIRRRILHGRVSLRVPFESFIDLFLRLAGCAAYTLPERATL